METDRSHRTTLRIVGTVVGLVLGFVSGLIVAWVYWSQSKEDRELPDSPAARAERLVLEPVVAAAHAEAPVIEGGPDDLTVIEGIGPRFSGVLQTAGICTYVQLGESRPDEIRAILHEEDPRLARLADPTTWPEQAILAAAGAWDALEELQRALSAGRRP